MRRTAHPFDPKKAQSGKKKSFLPLSVTPPKRVYCYFLATRSPFEGMHAILARDATHKPIVFMQKIIRVLELFNKYGLEAVGILLSALTSRPVSITVRNKVFVQHYDKSTIYHLLNSFGKLERLVDALPAQPAGVAIDGGANNGLFSFLLHERFPQARIYAFEPAPELQPYLRRNLGSVTVTLREAALAEASGEVTLYFCGDADQVGSTIRDNVEIFASPKSKVEEHRVPAVSLDDFVQSEGIERIAVLKLDVQGAELPILKGGTRALEITDVLLLECTFLDASLTDLLDFAKARFPYWKTVNAVYYGADIMFSKVPL